MYKTHRVNYYFNCLEQKKIQIQNKTNTIQIKDDKTKILIQILNNNLPKIYQIKNSIFS